MINIKKLIEYSEGGILSKELKKEEKISLTLFCMGQGTEISDHTSTKRGFVYTIEGEGTFNLEGKEIKMLPGALISLKENAVHSLKARENTSFLLFLIDFNKEKNEKESF